MPYKNPERKRQWERDHVAIGGMMGLAFLLTVLIVIWRLGSSAHPVATT